MHSVQKFVRTYSLRSRRVSKSAVGNVGDGQETQETDIELENATMETPLFSLAGRTVLGKIVKVVDGDSLHVVFRVEGTLKRFLCRLQGVDTPEKHSEVRIERERALSAMEAVSNLVMNKVLTVVTGKFDKFGRLLVDVPVDCEGNGKLSSLSEYLIANNLGRSYDGGHKDDWSF
jgi:endonuclease YncB( thermonuclease family)